jgi:glutathione S-transferase
MKLYDCQFAPNPRRARVFLKEKGLEMPFEEIDIMNGVNLQEDYRKINAIGLVPALELDDGKIICEVPAICRYLEAHHPEPNLFGTDPYETAMVEQWERYGEMNGLQGVAEVFRNQAPPFAERGLPGLENIVAIPALVERGKNRVAAYYDRLEQRLSESEYLASDRYTMADITGMCVVDFATFAEMGIPEGNTNTQRWLAACQARPSAQA